MNRNTREAAKSRADALRRAAAVALRLSMEYEDLIERSKSFPDSHGARKVLASEFELDAGFRSLEANDIHDLSLVLEAFGTTFHDELRDLAERDPVKARERLLRKIRDHGFVV